MRRPAVVMLLLIAACTSPNVYPGSIVLGTIGLNATLQESTCPFDSRAGVPDGGLRDGGSPEGLTQLGIVSVSSNRAVIYLTSNGATRWGYLSGGFFSLDAVQPRQVCTDLIDMLDERILGQFYGPPSPTNADGGCPVLFGPGLFVDGGDWPLVLPQLPDGGSLDGGAIDAGTSSCFLPEGLLAGATFTDLYTVPPDAGPDGGDLCAPRELDGGWFPQDDGGGGPMTSCAATYSLFGLFQQ